MKLIRQPDNPDLSLGTCDACGREVARWRGEADCECDCGAQYNCWGQRLRPDWRGNPSNYDDDITDMDGFEMQHAGDE